MYKAKTDKLKGKTGKFQSIVGNFNTTLSVMKQVDKNQ